jgi:hypothetical protein
MSPSRRWQYVAASSPLIVRLLIPTGTIDASLRALASGDHREVDRRYQIKRRWAVAADDHVVVELENMAGAQERLHVIADKHLLPERVT